MASAALAMGARCVLVRPMELSHLLHRIQTFGMAASPLQLRLRWMDLDQEGIKFYQCRLAAEAMSMLDEPHPQLKSIFVQVASQCHTQTGNVAKNVERAVKYAHSRNSPYYRALFGAMEKPPSTYRFLLRLTEGLRNTPTNHEPFRS
jgi:hypothetical protein